MTSMQSELMYPFIISPHHKIATISTDRLKILYEALVALKANGPMVDGCLDTSTAICASAVKALDTKFDSTTVSILVYDYHVIGQLAENWKHYSGNCVYPVPDPSTKELGTRESFQAARSIFYVMFDQQWTGPYGELRRKLLAHCVSELKNLIDKREV